MLDPRMVLEHLANSTAAMAALETCPVEHVSRRTVDGVGERLDDCPCARNIRPPKVLSDMSPAQRLRELGDGRYVSSPRHTLADLVRDALTKR